MEHKGRLLILSCSQKKSTVPGLVAAIDRYNGPAFQVVRKFLAAGLQDVEAPAILILSAKFGLISAAQPIPYYDLRMTADRAEQLHGEVVSRLSEVVEKQTFESLFVNLGRDYLPALRGFETALSPRIIVTLASGSQGRRLSQLRSWLYQGNTLAHDPRPQIPKDGVARIRGVEIRLTREQVFAAAKEALALDSGHDSLYQTWYVEVDDRRVGPKWLVSALTGMHRNEFVTTEAIRVLRQLGIPVYSIVDVEMKKGDLHGDE